MSVIRTVGFLTRSLLLWSLLFSFLAACSFSLRGAQAIQGADLLKVDVMAVLAHPDDETGMASALASSALGDKATIANVYCTRGEGGGNMVGRHWGPALGVLREAELRDCLSRLGVRYCFFLEQRDWAYTESMAATLRAWDKAKALERLVRYLRALRPEVILTMNPTPNPGQHGHHQAAAVLAIEAFSLAANPDVFPEQVKEEGLKVWQPRKLYCTGSLGENVVEISGAREVDGVALAQIVGEALSNHRSQGFGRMLGAPWLSRPRMFTLVKSVVPFGKEGSFFAGLPVDGEVVKILKAPQQGEEPSRQLEVRVVPRPAISRYEEWVAEQGIEHIAVDFLPDIPVVQGLQNLVWIELQNLSSETRDVMVEWEASRGLQFSQPQWRWEAKPGKSRYPIEVHPLELGDHGLKLTYNVDGQQLASEAVLHVVPRSEVPRVSRLDMDDELEGALLSIDPEQRVQGQIDGNADSRALVRVAHDGEILAVDVRVWDDVIVSNIAADDVRGHWRSDSVEICIDPQGGAEDSFTTFKVGIFPFVAGEGPAAARDADANQGPLEETSPGTRLRSERLSDGYRIRAHIPFAEAGIKPGSPGLVGFNVIIYDGDKGDAEPGENINQSRIAWSPRSGVQGRPEDWGRLRLLDAE